MSQLDGQDEATYKEVKPADDILPIARRDHSVALIRNNSQLLVFGGRSDNSLQ
jgi:hypothetical protein